MRLKPGLLRLSAGLLGVAADCQSIATGLPLVSPRAWPRKCAPREGGRRRAWRGEAGLLLQALSPGPGPTRADGQRVATERRSPPPGIPLYYSGHTGSISCHLEAPSQPPHSARANHDGGVKTSPGTPFWMVKSPQRIPLAGRGEGEALAAPSSAPCMLGGKMPWPPGAPRRGRERGGAPWEARTPDREVNSLTL